MKVFAKTNRLKKRSVRQFLKQNCPVRIFYRVNLINDKNLGLCYQYRMPSKSKLDLSLYTPVDDSFIDYLCTNKLRIDDLCEQQFAVDFTRRLKSDALSALKTFATGLTPSEVERFSSRINALIDSVNRECIPRFTDDVLHKWDELIKTPYFDTLDDVEL